MPTRSSSLCLAAATTLVVTGCASGQTEIQDTQNDDAAISAAAAFYPLLFVAESVGGDNVAVSSLTAPGVEPHDLELSPAVVREMQGVDVVLYLSGFQPAVDDAITTTSAQAIDAHHIAEGHESGHGDDHHADDDDHNHASGDPHFWLDPTLLAQYALDVAMEFGELDPGNAATYTENAKALETELIALDDAYAQRLAQCERRDIFVSHEAFGYITERYDLTQHGLSGLDPDAEPSPARVREIRDEVNATGATTVFSESLVDAAAIEALAADAGVDTAVLDPIEGVSGDDDYIEVMNRNLEELSVGLGCS